jgi:hypothetical protein
MVLNIIVDECWRCKNDYLVAYIDDDSIPYGPSRFTEKQIEIAKAKGVKIEEVHSKTMDTEYDSCVCPHCNSFLGDFFYHDFAYVPGNIQIKLDSEDNIINEVINEKIEIREHNGFDVEVDNARIEKERAEKQKGLSRLKRLYQFSDYNCVRVKFDNGKNYPYNCPFDAEVGDIVYVEGKLQGVKGEIVKIVGNWKSYKTMQEVIKVEKQPTSL